MERTSRKKEMKMLGDGEKKKQQMQSPLLARRWKMGTSLDQEATKAQRELREEDHGERERETSLVNATFLNCLEEFIHPSIETRQMQTEQ